MLKFKKSILYSELECSMITDQYHYKNKNKAGNKTLMLIYRIRKYRYWNNHNTNLNLLQNTHPISLKFNLLPLKKLSIFSAQKPTFSGLKNGWAIWLNKYYKPIFNPWPSNWGWETLWCKLMCLTVLFPLILSSSILSVKGPLGRYIKLLWIKKSGSQGLEDKIIQTFI